MWDEITRLAAERITILLTTHYLEEADRLAERLVIVDRGRVIAEGSPEQLKAELHGDAVHVELAGDAGDAGDGTIATALEPLGDIREVVLDGRSLRARTDDGARAVPVLLQALDANGIAVDSVTIARPSLDDVYLRHTGRRFTDADREGETPQSTETQEVRA
jgi:ABC-2 type transport system ATP-binding protein